MIGDIGKWVGRVVFGWIDVGVMWLNDVVETLSGWDDDHFRDDEDALFEDERAG